MAYKSFYGFLHSVVCQAICFARTVIEYLLKPFAEHPRYRMPALPSVAFEAPAAVRAFWSRITARCDDPVPRTA